MSWEGLLMFIDGLCFALKKDRFTPDVILAPGTRGAIIAELLVHRIDRSIPVFVGISYQNLGKISQKLILDEFEAFGIVDDWELMIPKSVLLFKDQKILIVDDFCLTGNFFKRLKTYLVSKGYSAENIKVYCAVVTIVSKAAGRAPEYFSSVTDGDDYYFPWGKANLG